VLLAGAGAAAVLLGFLLVIKLTRSDGSSTEIPLQTNEVARAEDLLQAGSIWRGEGEYTGRVLKDQPTGKFHCTLTITHRTGDRFKGKYEFEDGSKCAYIIEGTLGEPKGATGTRKIRWEHVQDIKGDTGRNYSTTDEGTILGAVLDVKFSHRDKNTGLDAGSGVTVFRAEQDAPSVIGDWDGTFQDGNTWAYRFKADNTAFGGLKFRGDWKQIGRKVILIDTNPDPHGPIPYDCRWEGEIDPSGKTMKLTNKTIGFFNFVRRDP
jgi:hypothetical protein